MLDGRRRTVLPQVKKSPPAPAPLVSITTAVPEPQVDSEKSEEKKELSPTWFWDLIAGIPSDEWGKVYDVWLLRRGESKVPMAPGEKGYLDQFMQPITPAVIKQRYGGGLYRAVLNKNGRFKTSHDFEIEGPAIYSSREMSGKNSHAPVSAANDATLQVLQQFRELLRDEFVRRADSGPGNSANEEAIKLLSSASERAMEVITKQVPQGASSTQQLAELVSIVKGIMPQQQESGLLALVLKPLIEKLLTPVDPLAQVTSFLAVFEKIDALRGESGGGKAKDWKAMLAEGIVQRGPEILREIRETQALGVEAAKERRATAEINRRTAETMRTIPMPAATPSAAPAAVPVAAAAPPVSTPLEVTPLNQAPVAETSAMADTGAFPAAQTAAPAPAVKAADDAVAAWVKQRIVQLIVEGAEPEAVVDFIDVADPAVSDLLVKYSEEIVTTFLAGDPVLKLAVEHPNWKNFLACARAYIQQGDALETASPN
jgi:hypothetical protein